MMLALHRHHFLKAIGYFGITEYLAPARFKQVICCWKRLGLSEEGLKYYKLHCELDSEHSEQWLQELIVPMVDLHESNAADITRGILYRLNSSLRYLDAILNNLTSN